MKRKQEGRSENQVNKHREKTELGIERRVEKSWMKRIESRKEHWKEQKEQITTDFEILD